MSMAMFTTEEVDFLRSRGNDYCKKTWLGLYEGASPSETRDEQAVRDFMVDKYERKRYYLDPSQALRNGYAQPQPAAKISETKPLTHLISEPKPLRINGSVTESRKKAATTSENRSEEFIADFASADIFSAANNNNPAQPSFANFDNNPVFNNTSMPTSTTLNNMNNQNHNNVPGHPAPPEDRYAALKDLDNALKAQPTIDWNSGSSNSLYSSPTPAGSLYSSPSPHGSMYGSPSQGQFLSVFPQQESNISNPFNSGLAWNTNGNLTNGTHMHVNPFRANDQQKMNGFTQNFQSTGFPNSNGLPWTANPFKLGATSNGHSNNPFL